MPLIAALIGGVLGGVGGNLVKHRLDRQVRVEERAEASKILADSLRGEVKSLRDQMKLYRSLIKRYKASVEGGQPPGKDSPHRKALRYDLAFLRKIDSPVYNANLDEIGLLWMLLGKEVVEYYADFSALKRYSEQLSGIEDSEIFHIRVIALGNELHSLITESTVVLERLGRFSKDSYADFDWSRERRVKFLIGKQTDDVLSGDEAQPPDGD